MDTESINELEHIKKVMHRLFNKIMKDKDKNIAYHDYYVNLVNCMDLNRAMIDIANRPDEYIKIKKRCNPDEK